MMDESSLLTENTEQVISINRYICGISSLILAYLIAIISKNNNYRVFIPITYPSGRSPLYPVKYVEPLILPLLLFLLRKYKLRAMNLLAQGHVFSLSWILLVHLNLLH